MFETATMGNMGSKAPDLPVSLPELTVGLTLTLALSLTKCADSPPLTPARTRRWPTPGR